MLNILDLTQLLQRVEETQVQRLIELLKMAYVINRELLRGRGNSAQEIIHG